MNTKNRSYPSAGNIPIGRRAALRTIGAGAMTLGFSPLGLLGAKEAGRTVLNPILKAIPHDQLVRIFQDAGQDFYPEAGSAAWREAAERACCQAVVRSWREQSEREVGTPWEEIPEERYRDHFLTGDRSRLHALSSARHERLGRLALCAAIEPDNQALFADMLRGWRAVLAEKSWATTTHPSNASGIDPMTIDLRCANTALVMACLARIFRKRAPADLLAAVRDRLRRQIWENYLAGAVNPADSETRWKFRWLRLTSNWNAVCHHGVVASALVLCEDADMTARLVAVAARHLPHYLEGFGADGGCSEGPHYWAYGFGAFAALNQALEARSGGELSFFEGDGRIPKIARFPLVVTVENQQTVNFADAATARPLPPDTLAYLGRRLEDGDLARLAENEYAHQGLPEVRGRSLVQGFLARAQYLLNCPPAAVPGKTVPLELASCFLPDLQIWVSRGSDDDGRRWVVAAKCGHNEELHNHNDVGSYVLFLDGVELIREIGMPRYHRDYFSPAGRYRFLAARSFGHSVPVVNGQEQAAGPEFRGRVLEATVSGSTERFVLDLAGAYPPAAKCESAVRTLQVEKKRFRLRVVDAVETTVPGTVETAVITAGEVAPDGPGVTITQDGVAIRLTPDPGCRLRMIQEAEYLDRSHQPVFVRRIVFEPEERARRAVVGFTAEPLGTKIIMPR